MELGLRGTGVAITGGSRGIGLEIARCFAEEGANVAICAREAAPLEHASDQLRALGGKVFSQRCDVAEPDAPGEFLRAARNALGEVGVLVNNASGFGFDDDDASWRRGFDVDLMSAVRASRIVAPWMIDRGARAIVHILTTAALEAPGPAAYSALKAAMLSHAKNLAVELAPRGVRVNCVAPGAIEFPGGIWDRMKQHAPERYTGMRSMIPFGRMGTPQEVARTVVFLASPAAGYVTGALLTVDGGQHRSNL